MAFIVFPKGTPRRPGRNMTLGLTQLSLFQGSQGYGSTESDFVDIEGFSSTMPDTSLPELNLQVGYAQINKNLHPPLSVSFCMQIFLFCFVLWLNSALVTLVLPLPRRWVASMSSFLRGSAISRLWTQLLHRCGCVLRN